MKKTLKVIAAVALASITVYALAQVQVVGRAGGGQKLTSQSGQGIAMARMADQSVPQAPAITALRTSLAGELDTLILETRQAGKENAANTLREIACWSVLTTMTKAQQQYEIKNVWRLSEFMPNGEWDHVAAAPSMVSELLKVSPEVNAQIDALRRQFVREKMKPYDEFGARIRRETDRSGADYNRIYRERIDAFRIERATQILQSRGKRVAGLTSSQASLVLSEDSRAKNAVHIKTIRSLLTKAQNDEWSRIEAATRHRVALLQNGANPFPKG